MTVCFFFVFPKRFFVLSVFSYVLIFYQPLHISIFKQRSFSHLPFFSCFVGAFVVLEFVLLVLLLSIRCKYLNEYTLKYRSPEYFSFKQSNLFDTILDESHSYIYISISYYLCYFSLCFIFFTINCLIYFVYSLYCLHMIFFCCIPNQDPPLQHR